MFKKFVVSCGTLWFIALHTTVLPSALIKMNPVHNLTDYFITKVLNETLVVT